MSDEGVSSVAVAVEEDGRLLSAISVTDIAKVGFLGVSLRSIVHRHFGQIAVPSGNGQILSVPVHQFVTMIKV